MPLQGLKVVEIAGLAPAPFCGMILLDFGAKVVRVDKLTSNTEMDSLGHGKQSLAVNLKSKEGVKIVKKLCKNSDVLIEPFRPGVMESLGLGPDTLLKDNPKLIYARLTGYGQTGPLSKKAGHDINFISISGLLSLFGRKNEKPTFPANLIGDFGGGGLMCALGILLALVERNRSGLGQVVDSSMVRGSAYLGSWLYRSQSLPIWGSSRGENLLDSGSHLYEVYETKDKKYMSIGPLESQFYKDLLKGLELDQDEKIQYETSENLKKIFTEKFLSKTRQEWLEIFKDLDACLTPVLSLEEAASDEHNVSQNTFEKVGEHYFPTPSPLLSRNPIKNIGREKPEIGNSTKKILEELNYTEEEIRSLEQDGVVKTHEMSKL